MNAEFIQAMTDEIRRSAPIYQPSRFWEDLNQQNRDMLFEHGLENFKRTVAQNYFNWFITDWRNNQFRNLLWDWLWHPTSAPFSNKIEKLGLLRMTDASEKRIRRQDITRYKFFVGLLWELMLRVDRTGLSKVLEEPKVGNPFKIWRGKQLISQDLANSIREVNAILEFDRRLPRATVGELGAGYGRVGYVLLQNPQTRYFVFDVPPALAVSQWYLEQVFPSERVFRFRSFKSFVEVENELAGCRIAFFTPNQLELLPDRYLDIFMSISTLPEMTQQQIQNYSDLISRKTSSLVYFKQWREWRNDKDGFHFSSSNLHVDGFKKVLNRIDKVQDAFFEGVWVR